MTAMFPDSGVPPSDAKNSIPDPNTVNCAELWYSTSRCQPRFDPAAANAVLAELVNLINKGEVAYNCQSLEQVQLAVRYLIQRGLTTGAYMYGGPFNYTAMLDPTLTRYNDYLTLIIVPGANNQGQVQLDVDGKGYRWILRNDGEHLESGDLKIGKPALISYWAGAWYVVGLVQSQVPILIKGEVDIWIRTDGNDTTGDGSENTPEKAFRTIRGAWLRVGARYAVTPLFTMNFRLGVTGDYAGAYIGPFGGRVTINGDPTNPGGYRLSSVPIGNGVYVNMHCDSMSKVEFRGLTFFLDTPPPYQCYCLQGGSSNIAIYGCNFFATVNNSAASAFVRVGAGTFITTNGDYYFQGSGQSIGNLFRAQEGAVMFIGGNNNSSLPVPRFFFNGLHTNASYIATNLSVFTHAAPAGTVFNVSMTGGKYAVDKNSVLTGYEPEIPGDSPGGVSSGGVFVAA